jgi:hypothetical protein
MTVRLATVADIAYIIERAATIGQRYSPEWAQELLTDKRYVVAVEPPSGYFWVQLSPTDPKLVVAGYAIADSDAQVKSLYMAALAEALKRWPAATTLESRIQPTSCQAEAVPRATVIAKMTLVTTEGDGTRVYRVSRANLVKVLK